MFFMFVDGATYDIYGRRSLIVNDPMCKLLHFQAVTQRSDGSIGTVLKVVPWNILQQPDAPVKYPILADPNRKITAAMNMLDPDEKDSHGKPLASRALHIVGPDLRVSLRSSFR